MAALTSVIQKPSGIGSLFGGVGHDGGGADVGHALGHAHGAGRSRREAIAGPEAVRPSKLTVIRSPVATRSFSASSWLISIPTRFWKCSSGLRSVAAPAISSR